MEENVLASNICRMERHIVDSKNRIVMLKVNFLKICILIMVLDDFMVVCCIVDKNMVVVMDLFMVLLRVDIMLVNSVVAIVNMEAPASLVLLNIVSIEIILVS